MTASQKILAAHAGLDQVSPGQLVKAKVDLVLGNDITSPVALAAYREAGFGKVFDPERIALVMDHFTPNKDIKAAEQCREVRLFAREQGIKHFYDVGEMGVEHALLPEKGLAAPGELIIGADSHTCTYGALNAFSTGVGSTDMAAGMAKGIAWFKVPAALRFTLTGSLGRWVSGKDVILHIIGMIGVDGALYRSMEFTGPGVAALGIDDRLCVANMAIEAGAKNGIFPADSVTRAYLRGRVSRAWTETDADAGAEYERDCTIDLSAVRPTVAAPHLPGNAVTLDGIPEAPIDQVVIGSCTNGRISDLRIAAEVLKGRKAAKDVRVVIIPATQLIYRQAIDEGLVGIFLDAGCAVSTPTCGPCLGGHMGILAKGERAVATTNRNFVGRMGHPESEVYLASPAVAAASAVLGRVGSPEEL
jgi:3-isopropylmalate/(R)-2-methylmalate dehydratase large subunit